MNRDLASLNVDFPASALRQSTFSAHDLSLISMAPSSIITPRGKGVMSEAEFWITLLTALSVLIAAAGIMFSARLQRNLSKKQHTISTIMSVHFNERYSNDLEDIRIYLNDSSLEIRDGDISKIRTILNFYEFLSAALRNGDLDETLLVDMRGGTFLRFYERFQSYIESRRDALSRPKLYEHIEWFHRRYRTSPPGLPQRALEWLRGRPLYGKKQRP